MRPGSMRRLFPPWVLPKPHAAAGPSPLLVAHSTHAGLKNKRDRSMKTKRILIPPYGGTRWSYGAVLAVRAKGCLVATAAPSRNPRVLSV
ncbi:hypothetical protein CXB51_036129 [Gossypium anomalum]|uniref:Uncharacterized protein n=1 Tax=Gossypium anomalum TaxID=47600 RepID=A0A8J5XZZ5_9ROSI|nr:hypothetical protein CXB51_036129 [Gossypium anomalum]